MRILSGRAFLFSSAWLMALTPAGVAAQPSPPPPLPVQPSDPLADHLRTLAHNPHDLDALIGAGQSALSVGDATAALSFFGRANDVAPYDGRVKAGLGSALLLLERPDDALRLFGEAIALGIPQSQIAVDRGLAYDLRGDQASAQRDYRLALRDGQGDELVRRYALSLGIAGQKSEALNQLDPLLRKQDQAAWRDRTFILAMNGDVRSANAITRAVMPQQADAMAPFLKRLAGFTPAQRARAVTYGAMPEDVRAAVAIPSNVITPTQIAVAAPVRPPVAAPVPLASAPRAVLPAPIPTPAPPPVAVPTTPPPVAVPLPPKPLVSLPPVPVLSPPAPVVSTPIETRIITPPPPQPIERAPVAVAVARPTPPPTAPAPPPITPPPAPTVAVVVPPAPALAAAVTSRPAVVTAQPRFALSSLLDGVKPEPITPAAHVPTDRELSAARLAARRKQAEKERADAEAKAKADAEAKAKKAEEDAQRAAERRNPARAWVQIAGGNNRAGFARTWAKLKDGHTALFEGRNAYYTPLNRTYRILVGPFDDAGDARDFVNKLQKAGLSGFTFNSDAGQEVIKIGSKGRANGDTAAADDEKPGRKHRKRGRTDNTDSPSTKSKGDSGTDESKPKRKHHKK